MKRLIRNATISDCEPIAEVLWKNWHQLKIQQIATPLHVYGSREVLAEEIRGDLGRWLVCDSSDPQQRGFFALGEVGKALKKWGFPQDAVRLEHFACLLKGENLLEQFLLLGSHLRRQSILVVIDLSLRDAYWAALRAGFKLLGESPLVVGTVVWLYLDRETRHDEIRTKMRRAKVIAA